MTIASNYNAQNNRNVLVSDKYLQWQKGNRLMLKKKQIMFPTSYRIVVNIYTTVLVCPRIPG